MSRIRVSRAAAAVTAAAPAVVVAALAAGVLAGCTGSPDASAPPVDSGRAPVGPDSPQAPTLPAPCALVDATDLSLLVGMDDWQSSGSMSGDHTVCSFRGRGDITVTSVVSLLGADGRPLPAVCTPPNSSPAPAQPPAEACRYTGPLPDSTTVVVTGAGLAVGVRVVGRGSGRSAGTLAAHALTHL